MNSFFCMLLICTVSALPNIDQHFKHFDFIAPPLETKSPFEINLVYRKVAMKLVLDINENILSPALMSSASFDPTSLLSGHVKHIKNSAVRLTRTMDGLFEGVINFGVVNFHDLHIEPLSRYNHSENDANRMIIYSTQDLATNQNSAAGLFKRQAQTDVVSTQELKFIIENAVLEAISAPKEQPKVPVKTQNPKVINQTPKQNKVCKVAVVADGDYTAAHKDGSDEDLKRFIVGLVADASLPYESQLNVQLRVDKVLIHTEGSTDQCQIEKISSVAGQAIKNVQAIANCLQLTEQFCVVLVLSSLDLVGDTVGIANVGQVCTGKANTGLIVDRNQGDFLDRATVVSIISHETGHLFGASHDDALGGRCAPKNNRFLMFSQVQKQSESSNFNKFSSCSVDSMNNVIAASDVQTCLAI